MTDRRPSVLAAAVLAAMILPAVAAADCVNYRDFLHSEHLVEYPGMTIADGVLVGDVLVTAMYNDGLATVALEDGVPGGIIATLPLPGGAYRLGVRGDTIYSLSRNGPLEVVRLEPGGALTHLVTLELDGFFDDLCVADPDLVLLAEYDGITLVDVADPLNPVIRNQVLCYGAEEVVADGVIAHVAVFEFGVRSFDVGDPDAPFLLAHIPLDGYTSGLAYGDGRLVTWQENGGYTHVIDVTEPWAPVVTHQLDRSLSHAIIDGDVIHAMTYRRHQILELDDAGGVHELGALAVETFPGAMIPLDGGMLLMGGDFMEVVDNTPPESYAPTVLPLAVEPTDFAVDNGRVVTVDHDGWLRVFGIDAQGLPQERGAVFVTPYLVALEVAGDWAYVGADNDEDGLAGIDLSDPDAPQVAWTRTPARFHRHLSHDGGLLAVGCDGIGGGLYLFDVSDPVAPVQRGYLGYDGWDVTLAGDVAYVPGNFDGLAVVSVSDPDDPHLVRYVDTVNLPRTVAVAGDLLVTADYNHGIAVLDRTDPLWPQLIGDAQAPTGMGTTIAVVDDVAYLCGTFGFQVFDLTVPTAPVLVGGVCGADDRIRAHGHRLYTMSDDGDLLVFPLHCDVPLAVDPDPGVTDPAGVPAALRILSVAPNPCNPATTIRVRLEHAGPLSCRVFDLRGRAVATLADGWSAAGERVFRWNGRDAGGREAAAGTYLVRVSTRTEASTARVSLIK